MGAYHVTFTEQQDVVKQLERLGGWLQQGHQARALQEDSPGQKCAASDKRSMKER